MTRIALGLSFLGTHYHGWQSQPSGQTVQDVLEHALACFADERIRTRCAGRTDARVHALQQVVHFDTNVQRRPFSWVRGTNHHLPADIAVQWAQPVPNTFHASASATGRRYMYVLLESPVRPSLESGRVGWSFRPLDGNAMREAASYLAGTHDFSSFRAAGCQALTPVKTLQPIIITRHGAYWRFAFEADGFLYHMIRNIMGCLVYVGQGTHPPSWMQTVLQARKRSAAAPTFAAEGLYFAGPRYPDRWGLPATTASQHWLP